MKWKKMVVGLLSLTLFVSSAAGCSKSDYDKKDNDVAMGRYVEKAVDMPKAVQLGEEIAYLIAKNPEGQIEIYCSPYEPKDGEYSIQYTLNKDNTWERAVPKWLNEEEMNLGDVAYAPDGTKYAVMDSYNTDSVQVKIFKSTDNENAEEIILSDYKEKVDYGKLPYSIEILEDNSILLGLNGCCSVYKDGKEAASFKIDSYEYALSDNRLLAMNENSDGGIIVDVNTGKTISNVTIDSYRNQFATDKDGNWYLINDTGVQRMTKNGNTWETILDGNLASMSKPTLGTDAMIFGSDDDFYIMYQGLNGNRILKHYVYDKDVPATPSNTLSVVTLYESYTIKQAISDFNQEHPDVQVEYRALMSEDDTTTVTDHIKTINTELLAGKGADILVLDGLPVDDYIEKNVLADISDVINPLAESGDLLANIMDNFKSKDGKIYTAPLRITVPLAFGDKEAVNSTKSINTLADYAKKASIPLFGYKILSYSDLTTILFKLYSNSFLGDSGFDRDGLINFLQQLKVVSDQTDATAEQSEFSVMTEIENGTFSMLIYEKNALLGINDIYHMYSVYQPIAVADLTGGTYASINTEFTPHELISINNASTQKELASEFIKTLFGEAAQKAEIGDGYPVNVNALNGFGMAEDDMLFGYDDIEITQPSQEKMQSILDLCKTATTSVTIDQELLTMVIEEAEVYLSGKAELESTADKIINKTKTYLSE